MPSTLLMLSSLALGAHPASEPLLLWSGNSPPVGVRSADPFASRPRPESERERGGDDTLA